MSQSFRKNKQRTSIREKSLDGQTISKKKIRTAKDIKTWLISQIANKMGVEPNDIDVLKPFTSYGLSSKEAIILSGDLEEWLGSQFSPTLIYEYPNIEAVTQYLAADMNITKSDAKVIEIQKNGIEPIAIIGIGCRFPGANSPEIFWRLLRDGVDTIVEVPENRWDLRTFYDSDPTKPGKMNTRWGGFIEKIDQFDPQFFGISPREARRMDPQQRLLLEVAYEALEDAGQPLEKLVHTRTGVFIGISSNDYGHLQFNDPGLSDPYVGTGNALSIAANRISYSFGLRGPSMAVDTACSSSLVAIHLACSSLWNGEANLALVGGVNVILSSVITVNFTKAGFMAPDGRCKAFDARADGYVRGEGAGVVVLKPLSDAVASGDTIYAVVRGSAVNQDGRTNGLTAPSQQAQENVLHEAYLRAGVSPGQIQYVEAHGTGTALGDPIEAKALGTVLAVDRPPGNRCRIGSVKTNIGHLEAAAGIAGLIKVALMLKHHAIPPSLHFRESNPHIPFDKLPLQVQKTLEPWPESLEPRLAGISSFGFGGTNAHVVLEEAPQSRLLPQHDESDKAHLLTFSAHSPKALQSLAQKYHAFLANETSGADTHLIDICYNASVRRTHHDHRLALVAQSHAEFIEQIESFLQNDFRPGINVGRKDSVQQHKIVFVFSGQGSTWLDMGQDLIQQEPVFRETIEQCDVLLRQHANWSLLEELTANESQSRFEQTDIVQPAIFALQVALTALWRSWGIIPDTVVGHSVGEVSAAHVAGVLSLQDAIRIVFHRSRLMHLTAGQGKMAAVGLSFEKAKSMLEEYGDRISIAAINSPTSTVLSGEAAALEEVLQALQKQEIFCRMIQQHYAFHSSQMDVIQDELVQALQGIKPQPAAHTIFSTVTARISDGRNFDAAYWGRNMRELVRFAEVIDRLIKDDHTIFLENSPHPILSREISQCLEHCGQEGTVLASLRSGRGGRAMMLNALSTLYTLGYPIDWSKLYPDGDRYVRLPSYAWQRKRYWIKASKSDRQEIDILARNRASDSMLHPLLNQRLHSPLKEFLFESHLGTDSPPFLNEHRIYGMVVFPAAAYLEMGLTAAREAFGPSPHILKDVVIREALILLKDTMRTVQLILIPEDSGDVIFKIFGLVVRAEGDQTSWSLHATGKVCIERTDSTPLGQEDVSLKELRAQYQAELSVEAFYQRLREYGVDYGASFRSIEKLWRQDGKALAQIRLPDELEPEGYQLHPVLLDACFQLFAAAIFDVEEQETNEDIYLPIMLETFKLYDRPGTRMWSQALLNQNDGVNGNTVVGDVRLFDETGKVVAEVRGLIFKRLSREVLQLATNERLDNWLYEIEWQPKAHGESEQALEQSQLEEQGSWLIFSDRGGSGVSLAAFLEESGEACVIVFPGDAYEISKEGHFIVNPTQPEHFHQLFRDVQDTSRLPCHGVVHLWSLDAISREEMTLDSLKAAQALGCGSVLHLCQSLVASSWCKSSRLWLVTRGGQSVGSDADHVAVAQAPLWGLGNVIALELPQFHCVRVDLDPSGETDETQHLFQEIRSNDQEDQVAFRRRVRYVPRLVHHASKDQKTLKIPESQSFRLEITSKGLLDNLTLQPMTRRQPGPGEVEIRACATGLNFRDVMNVLGLYPGEAGPPGCECAGKIVAVGKDVEGLQAGDEVIAVASGSFSTYVLTPANLVVLKPENLSFEEAATIPITFLTAYYALKHLAKMSAGDRILIHAAAGGVGMAAVQFAQQVGAEIFATAGSQEKREFLRSLGIQHIMNSRSLDFVDEVMKQTNGQGVDIVLNSLSGDYIPKGLSILAKNGRFMEIGKIDIWNEIKVAEFRNDVSYFTIAMDDMLYHDPNLIQSMLKELMEEFNAGSLRPLHHRVFSIKEAVSAFRYMAQAKHIGKIVVSMQDQKASILSSPEKSVALRLDGTYLITGGLGGLGLTVAKWMVEQGARHLVLIARSQASAETTEVLDAMREEGIQVVVAKADVTQEDQVAGVLAEIDQSMPPLRGIIHAAGVLKDGMLLKQEWSCFARVLAPKVEGAWNLHTLTRNMPLDFFVVFSSVASLLGSINQGNYTAANAFLDTLAHYRRNQGLPALSINWGPWSEVGMGAVLGDRFKRRLEAMGMGMIEPDQGVQVLAQVLRKKSAQVAVLPIKLTEFMQQFTASSVHPPLLAELIRDAPPEVKAERTSIQQPELLQRLETAPLSEQRNILVDHIRDQVIKVLQLDPSHLPDPQQGLFELGMDSLMAVELKNRIESSVGISLPAVLTFDYPTIETLAEYLAKEVLSLESPGKTEAKPQKDIETQTRFIAEVEQLSENELETLIDEELEALKRGE